MPETPDTAAELARLRAALESVRQSAQWSKNRAKDLLVGEPWWKQFEYLERLAAAALGPPAGGGEAS